MKEIKLKKNENTEKALALTNADIKLSMPLVVISYRPENHTLDIVEKCGMGEDTYVFVNEELVDTFKTNYPTVNVIAREKYLRPDDFEGFERCPGGARMLSFRGMRDLGFKRIISCDDDLLSVEQFVPIYTDDINDTSIRPSKNFISGDNFKHSVALSSMIADMAFDHNPDAIVGEPAYSGFANRQSPEIIKYPGSVFCHSDYFFIDLERFKAVEDLMDMDNELDINMLKLMEDMFYALLIYHLGKTHFKTYMIIRSKDTAVPTGNDGRSSATLRELLPGLQQDERFKDLKLGEKLKVQDTVGKTLNKDYSYFSTRNLKKYIELIGGHQDTWNFLEEIDIKHDDIDISEALSTSKKKFIYEA